MTECSPAFSNPLLIGRVQPSQYPNSCNFKYSFEDDFRTPKIFIPESGDGRKSIGLCGHLAGGEGGIADILSEQHEYILFAVDLGASFFFTNELLLRSAGKLWHESYNFSRSDSTERDESSMRYSSSDIELFEEDTAGEERDLVNFLDFDGSLSFNIISEL
jgi:hypothetical protein